MNKKILLIDDDDDEQSIFSEAMHKAKIAFECIYANSAEQGMKLLDKLSPDFIFIDFNMPAKNGIECLREIKERTAQKQTPVILYSTGLDETLTNLAIHNGASACIRKTFSVNSLAESLKSILIPSINTVY